MKKEGPYTCPTNERCRSNSRCEALIPGTTKKNRPHVSPKTKAMVKQHINTTTAQQQFSLKKKNSASWFVNQMDELKNVAASV
jgi:hypothetical protein